jgi:nitroreductase
MDAIECLKTRRAVRVYRTEPVPRDVVEDIIDCGRLAATAINIQPWHFIAVDDLDLKRHIADITDYGKFIAQAGVCIAVFCEEGKYYLEDGSAATQNMLLAAKAHGLGSCWVAGDKKQYCDDIRKLLGLPEGYKLVSLIAIGYATEDPKPDKRPLSQVMSWNRYS